MHTCVYRAPTVRYYFRPRSQLGRPPIWSLGQSSAVRSFLSKLLISGYVQDRDYPGRPINLPWPNPLFIQIAADICGCVRSIRGRFVFGGDSSARARALPTLSLSFSHERCNPPWKRKRWPTFSSAACLSAFFARRDGSRAQIQLSRRGIPRAGLHERRGRREFQLELT